SLRGGSARPFKRSRNLMRKPPRALAKATPGACGWCRRPAKRVTPTSCSVSYSASAATMQRRCGASTTCRRRCGPAWVRYPPPERSVSSASGRFPAALLVIVDQSHRLHVGVADRGADELEALLPQILAHGVAL